MTPQKAFLILGACALGFQFFLRYDHWPLDDGRRAEYDVLTGKTVVLKKGQHRNLVQWITGAAPRSRSQTRVDDEEETFADDTTPDETLTTVKRRNRRATQPEEDGVAMFQQQADDDTDTPEEADPTVRLTRKRAQRAEADRATRKKTAVTDKTTTATTDTSKKTRRSTPAAAMPPIPEDTVDQLAAVPPPSPRMVDSKRPSPSIAGNDLNRDGVKEQIIQSPPNHAGIIDFAVVSNGKEMFYGKGQQLQVLNTRHQGWADLAIISPGDKVSVYHYISDSNGYEAVNTK
jgi:hypothetical protein